MTFYFIGVALPAIWIISELSILFFVRSVFQNICDFRKISPTEKCRIIFLVKSKIDN